MGKKIKKNSKKEQTKKDKKDKKEKKEKFNEDQGADFYLDDADADLAYNSSDLEEAMEESDESEGSKLSEHGSDLDFNEEDYVEEEAEDSDQKEKKLKPLTKEQLKKLMDKVNIGNNISISKYISLFTNINKHEGIDDENSEDNILSDSKIIRRIINYYILELPDVLIKKLNESKNKEKEGDSSSLKALIRKYVSVLIKYTKETEEDSKKFVFENIEKICPLILEFSNYIEIILKLSIHFWAHCLKTDDIKKENHILNFIKTIVQKKNKFFEYSIKIMYINYLDIAKEMNINSFQIIKSLQDDIINLLQFDLSKAYTTIFTFIRKLCIQLRGTIVEKTSASIKQIYNWQFVNSLILWGRALMKYVDDTNMNMLIYPLIQTIIGVIRLNFSEQFYPLRLRLVSLLNGISKISKIFIPTAMYVLPIIKSNYFIEKCKSNNTISDKLNKNKNKNKEHDDDDNKNNKTNNKKLNNRLIINLMLKIKKEEISFKQFRKDLLEEACDCLVEYISINSNSDSLKEITSGILKEIRSDLKKIYDKEYRQIIKIRVEKIEESFESEENKQLLEKEYNNIKRRRNNLMETIKSQKEGKFIEV